MELKNNVQTRLGALPVSIVPRMAISFLRLLKVLEGLKMLKVRLGIGTERYRSLS